MALLAAGLRPVRAVPIRFSQETVIGALGQAFGPSLVGPIERAAISLHGLQQAGAAAAAKAMPPLIPFGMGDERHFELAIDLKSQPTPFESMGVVVMMIYSLQLTSIDSWVHHYEQVGSI